MQDDLLYRSRPRVFAIAAELGTVRAVCRAMGIHPSTYCRWKRAVGRHAPEILAQSPCRNGPLPKIERQGMRSSPRRDRRPGRGIHARYRALVFVGASSGLRIGELAGLRPNRVDLLAGAVTVAEILTEVKGKLIAGPPKTRVRPANRRAATLRRL